MRTLILAGLTMVTVAGASAADAQRLGGHGANYPIPGQQPGGNVPVNLPPPPMVHTPGAPNYPAGPSHGYQPPRGYPGQSYPGRPYPGQSYQPPRGPINGTYPQHPRPGYPGQGGGSHWNGSHGGGSRWGGMVGGRWSGGSYAPGGWNAYHRPSRGYRLPSYWISPNFYIGDFGAYGLLTPPSGYSWQRYYDDAVLIDQRGKVWDSVYGVDWDGGYAEDGYASYDGSSTSRYDYAEGDAGYASPPYPPAYPPLPPVSRSGTVTTYQTGYPSGYAGYGGGTTTVVTIQPSETVTTTTTEYVEESTTRYAAPRRVYRAKKHYRPVVRRRCSCQRAEQPILGS